MFRLYGCPNTEKVTSQRSVLRPITAQLPRSCVRCRCYGNRTTKWRHIIDTVRTHGTKWTETHAHSIVIIIPIHI